MGGTQASASCPNPRRALRGAPRPPGAGRTFPHNRSVAVDVPVRRPERTTDDRGSDDRPWQVIVLNDNHNTFEGVAFALSHTLPGTSYERGLQLADRIHRSGRAVVWSGVKELAEHYHEQLAGFGLTMAPLEQA
jgi:ATP-dependent Clp protease adaptor protein ClpS